LASHRSSLPFIRQKAPTAITQLIGFPSHFERA
jgi:hypothetical protein